VCCQEWDHTRAQIFRGQAGEGLIPTLAVVARQRHDAAAEARSVWAECAARLRQIRRKVRPVPQLTVNAFAVATH